MEKDMDIADNLQALEASLEEQLDIAVEYGVKLSLLTTFRVGGPVDLLVIPKTEAALVEAVSLIHKHALPLQMLGRGSNILASDRGLRGALLLIADNLSDIEIKGNILRASAGTPLFQISAAAARMSLSGAEFMSGIPGTVGGALCMNAGAYESCMADIVISAELISPEGRVRELSNEELLFSYRHSYLSENPAVVKSVNFELKPENQRLIYQKLADIQGRRRASQPLEQASAGSSFKRPEGAYAAKLIADAGLKGYRKGQCGVSAKHSGFIVNYGDASSEDLLAMFREVRKVVYEYSGIRLEPEVKFLGERD